MGLAASETIPGRTDTLRPTQRAFIEAFLDCGTMQGASEATGVSIQTPYVWMRDEGTSPKDEEPYVGSFAEALLRAKEMRADRILERSESHALSDREDMPATLNRMFHIKRWYPQYRDQLNVKHSGAVLQARVDLNQLSPSERVELAGLLHRRLLASGSGEENVAVGADDGDDGGG